MNSKEFKECSILYKEFKYYLNINRQKQLSNSAFIGFDNKSKKWCIAINLDNIEDFTKNRDQVLYLPFQYKKNKIYVYSKNNIN